MEEKYLLVTWASSRGPSIIQIPHLEKFWHASWFPSAPSKRKCNFMIESSQTKSFLFRTWIDSSDSSLSCKHVSVCRSSIISRVTHWCWKWFMIRLRKPGPIWKRTSMHNYRFRLSMGHVLTLRIDIYILTPSIRALNSFSCAFRFTIVRDTLPKIWEYNITEIIKFTVIKRNSPGRCGCSTIPIIVSVWLQYNWRIWKFDR